MSNVQVHFQPIVWHNFILSFLIKITSYCRVIITIGLLATENRVFSNEKIIYEDLSENEYKPWAQNYFNDYLDWISVVHSDGGYGQVCHDVRTGQFTLPLDVNGILDCYLNYYSDIKWYLSVYLNSI